MKSNDTRTCLVCGTQYPAFKEFCPVCILREALGGQITPAKTSLKRVVRSRRGRLSHRFEHYELVRDKDGKPVELGRGAMGVTYKGFDVDLQCPVTLKVINEQYLGDESARLRFLREARAAARVRHTNVASVLHLGRTGRRYFYAMEFVEGETLEKLIKRSGRLEVQLALEITAQVAAGLTAVHKLMLVHRDIKPSNIMVNLGGGSAPTVKIIDLGLAKSVNESSSQSAISTREGFAGTPEFASPEQFAGVAVDIRSDLYSLGLVLWEMVTGCAPFRGSPAEVMYLHQHAPIPLEQLESIPQPVVLLLKKLLEKDPGRRFQNPADLLKVMPMVAGATTAGRRISRQTLRKPLSDDWRATRHRESARLGPKRVSIARLPATGSDLFGREEDIAFLDEAWTNEHINIVTIVAWAGVGKSALVNHWLGRMALEHYRSADLVFGWSFYRQGTNRGTSSADEFCDAALAWFGDPDPRVGTAWEKGERLAKLIVHRRTLLILDGLEPLQSPPGEQEGRLSEPSLQALLRDLAAFNRGLCVITTRLPVADIADHEGTSVLRCELEQLSRNAGANLLRALGVKGDELELQTASDEFSGHCLALTLLGSYLVDAYDGEIRCRNEASGRLAHDERMGAQARRVMESYQNWLGEGPELAVLYMLGLFDRPTDEKAFGALLQPPAILGITESLTDLSPSQWRTILAKLRRTRLLAPQDAHNPGHLDTHPLVREYFGERLRSQKAEAWKECNKRLFYHYQKLAPQLPDNFSEMEPLFLAVICGCNAGLFREALNEVYIQRIQRGNACFAANVLGVRGALLSVLVHFFKRLQWNLPLETGSESQSLTTEDEVFVLAEAALNLTVTRGMAAPEARICYERVESLSRSVNRPLLLYSALIGRWRFSLINESLGAALQNAKRVYSMAEEQNDAALITGGYNALACTTYYLGDFEKARQYAKRGVEMWRSIVQSSVEEVDAPAVSCLFHQALSEWHLGEISSCHKMIAEAISLAKQLNDMRALANAVFNSAILAHYERNASQAEHAASDVIELSTRYNFTFWLTIGSILRGWARSASGKTAEGISLIEQALKNYRAPGSVLGLPYFLGLKAEALHLAGQTAGALEAISEAETFANRFEVRFWSAELRRLRAVFLAALGANQTQIETSFRGAVDIARDQGSISLTKRAEASYAEYRHQRADS